jgi:hypothetical protein
MDTQREDRPRCVRSPTVRFGTGKKSPGGAGAHTGHADAQRHRDRTDEPHNHPNPPTTHNPHVSATHDHAHRFTHSMLHPCMHDVQRQEPWSNIRGYATPAPVYLDTILVHAHCPLHARYMQLGTCKATGSTACTRHHTRRRYRVMQPRTRAPPFCHHTTLSASGLRLGPAIGRCHRGQVCTS